MRLYQFDTCTEYCYCHKSQAWLILVAELKISRYNGSNIQRYGESRGCLFVNWPYDGTHRPSHVLLPKLSSGLTPNPIPCTFVN